MTDTPDDRFRRADPGYPDDDFGDDEDYEFPRWVIGLGIVACVVVVALIVGVML